MTQPGFIFPRDSHVTDVAEQRRLSGHSGQILARLEKGPVTNWELAQISLKYTGRISDLRKAGYRIEVIERDYASGRTVYALETT